MAIGYLLAVHAFSIRRGCKAVGISRAAYYRNLCPERPEDQDVIEALNALIEKRPRWGFWKCFKALRRKKHPWNHKRVYRVYCGLKLNQKRRAKKRIPQRLRQPLTVPLKPNEVWSADFMSDALYGGSRFRTFNVIDDFNRESLAVEVDTSITGSRLIRIFQRLQKERGLPKKLRTDNGPEFLSSDFVTWAEAAGMTIQYIQKGEPNQNAYIERFNRTYREEVLSLYLFEDLRQVRETTYWWRIDYNERRPHDALGDRTPAECLETFVENSTFELST